jgi:hypothetical protein
MLYIRYNNKTNDKYKYQLFWIGWKQTVDLAFGLNTDLFDNIYICDIIII